MDKHNKVRKILSLSTILFIVMLLVSSGSFAYWSWQSDSGSQTAITFTLEKNFECAADGGGNITAQDAFIAPSSCTNSEHAIIREIKVMPTIYDNNPITMALWLDINVLDSGLSNSQNFKYAISTSSTSCTDGSLKIGNFNGKHAGDTVTLLDSITYNRTKTDTYYLYIWLDKEETSSTTMDQNFSLSLNGTCTSAPEPQTYVAYNPTDNTLTISKGSGASPMNNTLTKNNVFMPKYTDNLYNVDKIENEEGLFDLENKSYTAEELPWYEYREEIKRVIFANEITPKSMNNWFSGMKNVEYIDVSKINTSKITNMGGLFSNVGYNAETFQIVGLDNWNTSNVTSMTSTFNYTGYSATTWNIGDLSRWNVSKVTTMIYMFSSAGYSATTWNVGDLSNWNTSSVTNMYHVFNHAGYSATTFLLDLSNWDTSKVTGIGNMFYCAGYSATNFSLDLSNWDTSSLVGVGSAFNCSGYSATTFFLNLSGWDTSNITDMSAMFLDAGHDATNWVLNLSGWDTSNVTNMGSMFKGVGYNANSFNLIGIDTWDTSSVTSMNSMFEKARYNSTSAELIDFSKWDLSSVTNMSSMFNNFGRNVSKFSLDLSGMDVSNVENMSSMFAFAGYASTTFELIGVEDWDTSSVTNMSAMFNQTGFKPVNWSLDLSGWNVELVTNYASFNHVVGSKVTPPVWVN